MVVAVRRCRLVACDAVAGVDALDQTEIGKRLQRAVDGCDSNTPTCLAQSVVDLLRAQTAVLAAEKLDDRLARAAAAVAGATELGQCMVAPGHVRSG